MIKAKKLGLPEISADKINQILSLVKQKSIEKHDTLSDDEFKAVVSTVCDA